MTRWDKIREMTIEEFIDFLKHCDFTKKYPIIEGQRFYNNNEIIEWLKENIKNV